MSDKEQVSQTGTAEPDAAAIQAALNAYRAELAKWSCARIDAILESRRTDDDGSVETWSFTNPDDPGDQREWNAMSAALRAAFEVCSRGSSKGGVRRF